MDFHELKAFIALADTLHFARAASQIHLSPSALSRLLFRLEEELGVSLFERDTRQVALTTEGVTFLAFAKECLYKKEDLFLRLGEKNDQLSGILRIYASVTACYSILPPFVEALTLKHPKLHLSVETGDPSDAAGAVRDGRAELALDALPPGGFQDLECYSVKITPLVFVSSLSGIFGDLNLKKDLSQPSIANSLSEKLEDVVPDIPLILPKTGLARERFDKWARNHGIRPTIAAETVGNEAVLALARLGLGLGLVPRLVLENGPFAAGLVIYTTGPEFGDYDIGFMQKPSSVGSEAARKLRSEIGRIIRETCKSLVP
jgi:LysR family transcriptional regulator, positive regulator for ilvC